MKRIKNLMLIVFLILAAGFSGCVKDLYARKGAACPANDPIGWWYRYGTGKTYIKPKAFETRHRFMF